MMWNGSNVQKHFLRKILISLIQASWNTQGEHYVDLVCLIPKVARVTLYLHFLMTGMYTKGNKKPL